MGYIAVVRRDLKDLKDNNGNLRLLQLELSGETWSLVNGGKMILNSNAVMKRGILHLLKYVVFIGYVPIIRWITRAANCRLIAIT